jgi:anti-sigma B factor antagonist
LTVEVIFLKFATAARVGTGAASGYRTPDEGWPLSAVDPISTSVAHHGETAVVAVGGEIDLSTAPAFEAAVATALHEEPAVLVIDLSDVTFMASVGLRILVATQEELRESVQVAVVANNPATSRPIEMTGLQEIISLYPTLDDALVSAKRRAAD